MSIINIESGFDYIYDYSDEDRVFQEVKNGNIDYLKRALTTFSRRCECERSKEGETLLHVASQYGHEEIVKHLLLYLKDVDPIDNAGNTPLHYAAYRGHTKIVDMLLTRNADASAVNDERYSVYAMAINGGNISLASTIKCHICRCHERGCNNELSIS